MMTPFEGSSELDALHKDDNPELTGY